MRLIVLLTSFLMIGSAKATALSSDQLAQGTATRKMLENDFKTDGFRISRASAGNHLEKIWFGLDVGAKQCVFTLDIKAMGQLNGRNVTAIGGEVFILNELGSLHEPKPTPAFQIIVTKDRVPFIRLDETRTLAFTNSFDGMIRLARALHPNDGKSHEVFYSFDDEENAKNDIFAYYLKTSMGGTSGVRALGELCKKLVAEKAR